MRPRRPRDPSTSMTASIEGIDRVRTLAGGPAAGDVRRLPPSDEPVPQGGAGGVRPTVDRNFQQHAGGGAPHHRAQQRSPPLGDADVTGLPARPGRRGGLQGWRRPPPRVVPNLLANPDVELTANGTTRPMRARTATDEERAAALAADRKATPDTATISGAPTDRSPSSSSSHADRGNDQTSTSREPGLVVDG